MTIVEFLTARLDEDEQRALDLNSANWTASGPRELREAEAKRLVLRQARFFIRQSDNTPDGDTRIHGAATAYAGGPRLSRRRLLTAPGLPTGVEAMTTYFTAPDGHGEPALWVAQGDLAPAALIRRCDLGPMAHHWDELVARVIAGNPDRMIDRDALTQGIERVNNTDSLAAAIADRTGNAAAALHKAADRVPMRLSEGEHWAPGIPDHIAREMNK